MEPVRVLLGGLGSGVLLLGGALGYAIRQMSKPPPNAPAQFLRGGRQAPNQRVVVCLGASLVHGRVGDSFVARLAQRFPAPATVFVNAGVNGDTALHAQARLDSVIACDPDDVVILVGTNDVLCTLNPQTWRMYRGAKRLSQAPTLAAYQATLTAMVRQLQQQTRARIALCSLPPLGEDLDAPANAQVQAFNAVIRQVAGAAQVGYVPVYEAWAAILAAQPGPGRAFVGDSRANLRLGFLANLQHYLLGRSYDLVARRHGLQLTPDLIHCNERSGVLTADQIAALLAAPATAGVERR